MAVWHKHRKYRFYNKNQTLKERPRWLISALFYEPRFLSPWLTVAHFVITMTSSFPSVTETSARWPGRTSLLTAYGSSAVITASSSG